MDYSGISNSKLKEQYEELTKEALTCEDEFYLMHQEKHKINVQKNELDKRVDDLDFDMSSKKQRFEELMDEVHDLFDELEYRRLNGIVLYSMEELEKHGQMKLL